jgi:hypothetical protein
MTTNQAKDALDYITCLEGSAPAWQSAKYLPKGWISADLSRFWAKVDVRSAGECWLWTASKLGGRYGQFCVTIVTTQHHLLAHRVAWELGHQRPIPEGLHVMHFCDVPLCVNPAHLIAGTHTDNMRDASRKGRLNVPRKRNRERIAEIQTRWLQGGISQTQLATEYGTSVQQIGRWLKPVSPGKYARIPSTKKEQAA